MKEYDNSQNTALPSDSSGKSSPNVHTPNCSKPDSPKYSDHPVYHDVATYCSYVLPKTLYWTYASILEDIQNAPDPNLRCRELLLSANTWKEMAPHLNQDGQDSLVDLLFRINCMDNEIRMVLLADLRRIFRNFNFDMPQTSSFNDLPDYLRGPDEDDLEFEASRFNEPGLSAVAQRCESLARYEDAHFDMWTSDRFHKATVCFECNYAGNVPIDSDFWRMPVAVLDTLQNLRRY